MTEKQFYISSVPSSQDLADTIELQNGCACCTLQDELFASLEQIISLADKRGEPYARIVLENSGVAEPAGIRDRFNEAEAEGHPLLERLYLDTMVTLVDSSTFTADFATRQALAARPDLGDGGNLRPVVDLLVEQIEVADFVVLNKMDLLEQQGGGQEKKDELIAVISTLNPLATVVPCANGQVPLEQVFGPGSHGSVIARLNVEGQHRGAVAAARAQQEAAKQPYSLQTDMHAHVQEAALHPSFLQANLQAYVQNVHPSNQPPCRRTSMRTHAGGSPAHEATKQGRPAACTVCEQKEETKYKHHNHSNNMHGHVQ
ncbi:CobW/HypB/UreG, nucleotide-binding domain-containing protein [Dunaliella salina]|uniref:CobW/HypB/UreG, nucleotide-binding domain-containing protein n=1 Tax=Dunaliella salina TaxID=3046 RepID=A0ABQ7G139_DUNSA|nr:CobW/HypB/UreG, nucleotide-binding domain-containing protein [Dunaliella salina]|eukprot:KAF5828317.1 CobW/HypB/UreG, nucleotide-binding domain-containing protein [Dunaliella salina]